jgi:predicted solute-binding protein
MKMKKEKRSYPALAAVRVGCVQYLNSKPLIYGADFPVRYDHPAGLARDLVSGALDVALVPVFEALLHPPWLAVDGVAIACDGPVFSVFLAHRGPLAGVRRIALDPASRTSVHLLRVLLAEFHDLQPEYVGADDPQADAWLLIGNQAIDFRLAHAGEYEFLDLGEEWRRCTGLPFVFALWLMRPALPHAAEIAAELRAIKAHGLAHLPEIVRADVAHPAELSMRYLTRYIRFELGAREKAGLARFEELLLAHRWIEPAPPRIAFI